MRAKRKRLGRAVCLPWSIALVGVLPGALATIEAADVLKLSAPIEIDTTLSRPVAVALADINLDQKLDAAAVGNAVARYACYAGNGDGSFGAEIAAGALYLEPRDLVIGDFNGDGFIDIAAINGACLS